MTSLSLFGNINSQKYADSLIGKFSTWRRTCRYDTGYHIGTMVIDNRGILELTNIYNSYLGKIIKETSYGITTYKGLIWQLDLIKDGMNYRRSFIPEHWHNRIKATYLDAYMEQQNTTWATNDSSISIYGEMEYILALGQTTDDAADARRDRELNEYAYPISKAVGGINLSPGGNSDKSNYLVITTVGLGATLNWQIRETDTTDTASSLISTLIGETDYVTAGNIETNSLSVTVTGAQSAIRIGDAISDIIAQGDASGNIWRGGVYNEDRYDYELIPNEARYQLSNGRLFEQYVQVPVLTFVRPGFYLQDISAPASYAPPGLSGIQNEPKITFCNEVEFVYPDSLILKFPDEKVIPVVVYQPGTAKDKRYIDSNYPEGYEPPPLGEPGDYDYGGTGMLPDIPYYEPNPTPEGIDTGPAPIPGPSGSNPPGTGTGIQPEPFTPPTTTDLPPSDDRELL